MPSLQLLISKLDYVKNYEPKKLRKHRHDSVMFTDVAKAKPWRNTHIIFISYSTHVAHRLAYHQAAFLHP
jgi:hypothetical protein